MIELFAKVSRKMLFMAVVGTLIAVVSLWISWKVALSHSEVGQSHIKL